MGGSFPEIEANPTCVKGHSEGVPFFCVLSLDWVVRGAWVTLLRSPVLGLKAGPFRGGGTVRDRIDIFF